MIADSPDLRSSSPGADGADRPDQVIGTVVTAIAASYGTQGGIGRPCGLMSGPDHDPAVKPRPNRADSPASRQPSLGRRGWQGAECTTQAQAGERSGAGPRWR